MFISNQARLKRYRKDRFIEEQNDAAQQTLLYSEIAIQHGEEEQAAGLVKLAERTFSKLTGDTEAFIDKPIVEKAGVPQLSGYDILKNAVKSGKLDELFKSVIKLPDSVLNATQKLIKKDLMNPEFKKTINETIADALARKEITDDILSKVIREAIGGDDYQSDFDEMLKKGGASTINTNFTNYSDASSVRAEYDRTKQPQLDFSSLEELLTTKLSGDKAVQKMKDYLKDLGIESSHLPSHTYPGAKKEFEKAIKKSKYYKKGIPEVV